MSERQVGALVLAFILGYLAGWEVHHRQQQIIIKDMSPEPGEATR